MKKIFEMKCLGTDSAMVWCFRFESNSGSTEFYLPITHTEGEARLIAEQFFHSWCENKLMMEKLSRVFGL